jgi:flagellar basal body rod protein FlgB
LGVDSHTQRKHQSSQKNTVRQVSSHGTDGQIPKDRNSAHIS